MEAPGGNIILTVVDPAIKPDHPGHLFTSPNGQFDSGLCRTPTSFTILPNEGHVLITDLDKIYGALLRTPSGVFRCPLSLNIGNDGIKTPLRLCYGVQILSSYMMLHVERNTSLSQLTRTECLRVTPFFASPDQIAQLIRPFPSSCSESLPPQILLHKVVSS